MRRSLVILLFASISSALSLPVEAAVIKSSPVNEPLKRFKLDIPAPKDSSSIQDNNIASLDSTEPADGNILSGPVTPAFHYGKDTSTYSPRLEEYNTEFKVNVKVPVDLNFGKE